LLIFFGTDYYLVSQLRDYGAVNHINSGEIIYDCVSSDREAPVG